MRKGLALLLMGIGLLLSNCSRPWNSTGFPVELHGTLASALEPAGLTPFADTPTSEAPRSVTSTATAATPAIARLKIWIDPLLPAKERERWLSLGMDAVGAPSDAGLRLTVGSAGPVQGQWVMALVAPFPTLTDGISSKDLKAAWQGAQATQLSGHTLLVAPAVLQALTRFWGPPALDVARMVAADQLVETAWKEKTSWAIVPFETLQPRWKVLKLDGRSPLDKAFDPVEYGLTLNVGLEGEAEAFDRFRQVAGGPAGAWITNRDPARLTVVLLTGTSGLTRGTAWYMEQKGLLYPGRDVRAWLREADITHVSHEVSFNPKCPAPNPNDPNLRFCSAPRNIQLFEDMGVKVVELTGNHLNDFGSEWVNYSIELYRQRGWWVYGAGANQQEARKPIRLEHNGNKLAFLGCNPAGPAADWATQDRAGTADCDYPDMTYFEADIRQMVKDGYLPIVTVQFYESYEPRPLPIQYRAFQRLADAGAVIVSGSQAHLPQAMELRNNGFIHYGLGNLFFDQMDTYWPETKDEFLDRHVFYEGRYLGVELLTAQLEDYVKPRPMTVRERDTLLKRIFEVSGWAQTGTTQWR